VSARVAASRLDASLRVLAAIAGTLPVAALASTALARFLPLPEDVRASIGFVVAVPLWIAAMCVAFLARSGKRAWLGCAGATALLAALVYGVPH